MSLLPLTDLSCLSTDTVWSCIQKRSAVKPLASHATFLVVRNALKWGRNTRRTPKNLGGSENCNVPNNVSERSDLEAVNRLYVNVFVKQNPCLYYH